MNPYDELINEMADEAAKRYTMTNDPFTEWLESQIKSLIADEPQSFTNGFRVGMVEALKQYRQLAPTWIPVTPEVTQLIEAAREANKLRIKVRILNKESQYYKDTMKLLKNAEDNLSSALKPFEK